eukprot:TRINITY_DN476_c0_g1_i1.p1 TRINITY_DN476_c0_g1~~TRINITY_DN476_c0_g1_i1.p1  ORF type:complete len:1037 (-),score=302.85 TRINITY_DN476_c0_g1_i1:1976-5086(-)
MEFVPSQPSSRESSPGTPVQRVASLGSMPSSDNSPVGAIEGDIIPSPKLRSRRASPLPFVGPMQQKNVQERSFWVRMRVERDLQSLESEVRGRGSLTHEMEFLSLLNEAGSLVNSASSQEEYITFMNKIQDLEQTLLEEKDEPGKRTAADLRSVRRLIVIFSRIARMGCLMTTRVARDSRDPSPERNRPGGSRPRRQTVFWRPTQLSGGFHPPQEPEATAEEVKQDLKQGKKLLDRIFGWLRSGKKDAKRKDSVKKRSSMKKGSMEKKKEDARKERESMEVEEIVDKAMDEDRKAMATMGRDGHVDPSGDDGFKMDIFVGDLKDEEAVHPEHHKQDSGLPDSIHGVDVVGTPETIADSPQTMREKEITIRKFQAQRAPSSSMEFGTDSSSSGEEDFFVLCRLCEESIPLSMMEEHSNYCFSFVITDQKARKCAETLVKLCRPIDYRLVLLRRGKVTPASDGEIDALEMTVSFAKRLATVGEWDSITGKLFKKQTAEFQVETKKFVQKKVIVPELNDVVLRVGSIAEEKLEALKDRAEWRRRRSRVGGTSHRKPKPHVQFTDFEFIKPITRGAYGRVFLARKKVTLDLYAVKILRKDEIKQRNMHKRVRNERKIMALAHSDFVVSLVYAFEAMNNLYLVMEYMPGGDLFSLLQRLCYFSEDMTSRYIAEIVLALESLHSQGIAHRDLKPDNILLDAEGHVKLTDFGLSRWGVMDRDYQQGKDDESTTSFGAGALSSPGSPPEVSLLFDTSSYSPGGAPVARATSLRRVRPTMSGARIMRSASAICGTPDYVAPEVILNQSYGSSVDFWALGIITFEFLCGFPPFNDETQDLVFERALDGVIPWDEVHPDIQVSKEAKDFIERLLVRDPDERLGANGIDELKAHPFFRNIDWETVRYQEAPYIPVCSSPEDTSGFDHRKPWFPVLNDMIEDENSQEHHFPDFQYQSPESLANINRQIFERRSSLPGTPRISPTSSPRPSKDFSLGSPMIGTRSMEPSQLIVDLEFLSDEEDSVEFDGSQLIESAIDDDVIVKEGEFET